MKMKAITKDVDLSDGKAVQEVFMQLQAINPREASSWLSSVKPIINQHIEQQKMSATSSKPNTAQERFLDDKQASLLQRNFNVTTVEGLENFIRTATERYGLGHTTVVNKASTNLTTLQAGDRANTRAAELARLRELKADQDLKDTQTAMTVTEKTAVSQYVNVLKGLDVKGDTLLPQGKNEEPIEVAKTLGHFLHSYQKRLQTRKYDKASVKPSEVSKYFTPLLKAFKDIYDNGSVSWGIDKPSYFNAENATAMLDKILGVDGASLSEDERALLIQAGVPVRAPDAAPQINEKEIVENNMVISDALQAHIRKLIKDGNRKQLREDESNGLYTRAMFEYVLGQGQ
jgi:hypothetical protein